MKSKYLDETVPHTSQLPSPSGLSPNDPREASGFNDIFLPYQKIVPGKNKSTSKGAYALFCLPLLFFILQKMLHVLLLFFFFNYTMLMEHKFVLKKNNSTGNPNPIDKEI